MKRQRKLFIIMSVLLIFLFSTNLVSAEKNKEEQGHKCEHDHNTIRISHLSLKIKDPKKVTVEEIKEQIDIKDSTVKDIAKVYNISEEEALELTVAFVSTEELKGLSCFYCSGSLYVLNQGREKVAENIRPCAHGMAGHDKEITYHCYKTLKCDTCQNEFRQDWNETEVECYGHY